MKLKTLSPALCSAILLASSSLFAQVKIGTNPTTISPNTNLEVEAASGYTKFTVKKDGRVGINTDSPAVALHVKGGFTYFGIGLSPKVSEMAYGTAPVDGILFQNDDNTPKGDGVVYIQRSGASSLAGLYISRNATLGSAAGNFQLFSVNGAVVGYISTNGSTTTYNTASDRRLKENIKDTRFGLSDLMKVKVSDYNYVTDKSKTSITGFIAQDLYKIFPSAVTVGGENASEKPWAVDYGKVTPLLAKAIQEQQAQIEALKDENKTLRSQSEKLAARLDNMEQKMQASINTEASIGEK